EPPAINLTQAFKELVQIGITLTSERDLSVLLERILTEARRFTRAEAGTLFLREGDQLRFAVVQNDRLAGKLRCAGLSADQHLHARPISDRENDRDGPGARRHRPANTLSSSRGNTGELPRVRSARATHRQSGLWQRRLVRRVQGHPDVVCAACR